MKNLKAVFTSASFQPNSSLKAPISASIFKVEKILSSLIVGAFIAFLTLSFLLLFPYTLHAGSKVSTLSAAPVSSPSISPAPSDSILLVSDRGIFPLIPEHTSDSRQSFSLGNISLDSSAKSSQDFQAVHRHRIASGNTRFIWPCGKSKILKTFQQPEHFYSAGHRGVTLTCLNNSPIKAALSGKIYFSGVVAGVPSVSIQHDNGFRTTYLPVESSLKKGEIVEKGSPIGKLVNAENSLHFGVKIDKHTYLNPLLFLPVKIRLIQ